MTGVMLLAFAVGGGILLKHGVDMLCTSGVAAGVLWLFIAAVCIVTAVVHLLYVQKDSYLDGKNDGLKTACDMADELIRKRNENIGDTDNDLRALCASVDMLDALRHEAQQTAEGETFYMLLRMRNIQDSQMKNPIMVQYFRDVRESGLNDDT